MHDIKLKRILERICCPVCKKNLNRKKNKLICNKCNASYYIKQGIPEMMDDKSNQTYNRQPSYTDRNYSRKRFISKIGYKILKKWDLIKIPHLYNQQIPSSCSKIIKDKFEDKHLFILHIGGRTKQKNNIFNLNIAPNKYIDIIADAHKLPFKNNSVDGVIIVGTLPLLKAQIVIEEIERVLKKEGLIYCTCSFLRPYQPDPIEIQRFTKEGLENLFSKFKILECRSIHGPTTTLILVLQRYLPILFSFNNVYLYHVEYTIFSYLLWPFKYLDNLLHNHYRVDFISGGFCIIAKK